MTDPRPISASSQNSLANHMKRYLDECDKLREKFGKNYDKPAKGNRYGLTIAEVGVIDDWVKSLEPEILAIQKQSGLGSYGDGQPYYGAVGGGLTYSFTPTSLGTIVVVKESTTGKELNVSDACGWVFYG